MTDTGMQRDSAAGGDQLPSSGRAPQVSAAAPTAEASSSEHASKDEPSGSEQLSGAAEVMSLEEKIRGDKTNHNSIQSRWSYKKGLLQKAAAAHNHGVSVAIVVMWESCPSNSKSLVTGLAAAQKNLVMPLLAKVTTTMAGIIKSCPKQLAETASEAAVQQLKQQKRPKKGPSRTPLGHGAPGLTQLFLQSAEGRSQRQKSAEPSAQANNNAF